MIVVTSVVVKSMTSVGLAVKFLVRLVKFFLDLDVASVYQTIIK